MIRIREVIVTSTNIGDVFNNPKLFGVIPSKYSDGKYELKPLGNCAIRMILSGEFPVIEIIED